MEAQVQDTKALGAPPGGSLPATLQKSNDPDPFSESSLKVFFAAMKSVADEHRRPREIIWDQAWDIYNNRYDWSTKSWWQHRVPVPKVRGAVDRAVAIFRKSLLRLAPFYGVQAESKLGKAKGRYTMLITDYWFDQSNVIEELVTAFRVGLITSVSATKIWWTTVRDFKPEVTNKVIEEPIMEFGVQTGTNTRTEKEVKLTTVSRGKLGIKAINPKNLWVVPNTNRRAVIERDQATLNEIESLADAGVYDKDAVKRLREKITAANPTSAESPYSTTGVPGPESGEEGAPSANDYLRLVDLWHYWGDIYDTSGKLVKADASFTLANEDILIRPARDNPFFHKEPPYVIGTPYQLPFSTYGRSMVEDVMQIAISITNMANLVADSALYDAMKAFAIDTNMLEDATEARSGIYPGKVFTKNSDLALPGAKLVETIDVGGVPDESMNMIRLFEEFFESGSFVNNTLGGKLSRGDKTLGEIQTARSDALEGLDESARNLEVTVIEPVVDMSTKVIYQYHANYMLPRLIEQSIDISILLQQLTPAERYAIMIGDYTFKVRGLSIMVEQAQKMGEFERILTLLSFLPGFLERLSADAILEEIFMPLGWDPRRLLLNPGTGGVTGVLGAGGGGQGVTQPEGRTPMQERNAQQGTQQGGSRNNPNARRA